MNTERNLSGGVENKKWSVVPFEPLDLPALGRYFKKQYTGPGTYGTMGMFQWKIINNYVKPGIINLVKDNGEIVCTMSVTPKLLFFKRCEKIVAEIGDIYTDPEYQRKGLFALLANHSTKEAMERDIPFIYGLPNKQAQPGWEKRAKYKTISDIKIKSLILPINIKPLIQRHSHWLFGIYATAIFSTLMFGYSLIKGVFIRNGSTQIVELNELPDDWDDFWEKARLNYDFIFSRDRQSIEWRYFRNPEKYKIYVSRDENRITGYVICRPIYDIETTTLHVADFLTLPGREEVLENLLFQILQRALRTNVNNISAWCPEKSPYFQILRRFGFLTRSEIPIISYQNDFAKEVESECRTWHFTISDSDNI